MFVDIKDYGFTEADYTAALELMQKSTLLIPGRVIEQRRNVYGIVCEHGVIGAEIKGSFYHKLNASGDLPAVGDFVLVQYNEIGNSLITQVLPRRSKFSRTDFLGHGEAYAKFIKEQVVAVNFDYVFIVTSLNQDFNSARLSRYLSASLESGGFPVIVLTKTDLCQNPEVYIGEAQKLAHELPVVHVSNKTGAGIENLLPFLQPGKTIVFLGSSGVGKSSLLNRLAGEQLMDVYNIREDDDKGRHTTSHRQLFRLPGGALVIDTPGMRELGLWASSDVVHNAFPEIEVLISQCRFSDCAHQSEPGCAVTIALDNGSLPHSQWKKYQSLRKETDFVENHSDYLRQKREIHKSIARINRENHKRKNNFC